ncbi:hypothetical protein IFDJLNFL_1476 [Methylobacterium dankookense]|jgi:hypothetical protein|uniref:Uncharacterized protein n=3 Tax=Methylobacterium dankookense TaxID=560405 RepID=A0ABQ4RE93_9HYPH|nr:hypothetical protein IFDJLNFL_1476 [Methylobacterium dankookense]
MDATIAEIIEREGMARELATRAHELAQHGHHATAELFRQMGRQQRVKGMELRGNLGASELSEGEPAEDSE